MSPDHHVVRNFVVRELPRLARPVSIGRVVQTLQLPRARVQQIVEELEARLFFLARPDSSEISWAFPVTAERTGHDLAFSTGERLDAA
jgi:hypothetical protein